jgi:hypothetical protein
VSCVRKQEYVPANRIARQPVARQTVEPLPLRMSVVAPAARWAPTEHDQTGSSRLTSCCRVWAANPRPASIFRPPVSTTARPLAAAGRARQFHGQLPAWAGVFSLPMLPPPLVPRQRRQNQAMLPAEFLPTHPAGLVFEDQLLGLRPAPPPWPSHLSFAHPSTSTLDRSHEQMAWSDAYGQAAFAYLLLLHSRPSIDRALLATSLPLVVLLAPAPTGDAASHSEVTHHSSVPCHPQTPWCGG